MTRTSLAAQTVRAVVYARISRDLADDEHGVKAQVAGGELLVSQRSMSLVRTYVDNDISALSGARRPGYEAMMSAAARGEFDAIVVFHFSRLWRNRKERAEGIEILKKAGISVIAIKGPTFDVSSAYGRAGLGLLGEMDTLESELKSERQVFAAVARAERGDTPLGVRLMGYTTKGALIPEEAEVVERIFDLFYTGASLFEIVAILNRAGVPTRHGRPWSPSSVRTILTNPRYCGRVVYRGQVVQDAVAQWEPLVDEAVFDEIQITLSDPRRRKQQGTGRKHMGSGLWECGICDYPVRSHTGSGIGVRYRCRDGHLTKIAKSVDEFVVGLIRQRLARPDLAAVLNAPAGGEAKELSADIRRLRTRIRQFEADYDAGVIDGRRFRAATDKAAAELELAESRRAKLVAGNAVAAALMAADPVAAFDAAPLGVQREVISFFVKVKLFPGQRGHKFDPEDGTVQITWNEAA